MYIVVGSQTSVLNFMRDLNQTQDQMNDFQEWMVVRLRTITTMKYNKLHKF